MGRNVVAAVFFAACFSSGCSQYESGNRDRENCGKVATGMSPNDVTHRMGKAQSVRRSEGEEVWVYGQPSMPDLPIFAEDKPVELVFAQSPSGPVLKEARCSGIDG
jgi:hypothetical protein